MRSSCHVALSHCQEAKAESQVVRMATLNCTRPLSSAPLCLHMHAQKTGHHTGAPFQLPGSDLPAVGAALQRASWTALAALGFSSSARISPKARLLLKAPYSRPAQVAPSGRRVSLEEGALRVKLEGTRVAAISVSEAVAWRNTSPTHTAPEEGVHAAACA